MSTQKSVLLILFFLTIGQMSIDNLAIDFNSHVSLELKVPTPELIKNQQLQKHDKKTRNRQIVPSDDEDEDEDEEEDNSDDSDVESKSKPRTKVALRSKHPKQMKSQPLPSDDEEEEEDEISPRDNEGQQGEMYKNVAAYDQDDDVPLYYNTNNSFLSQQDMYDSYNYDDDDRALVSENSNTGPVLNLVEGSHLQHLHYQQQYHQAQLAQFQYMQQQQQQHRNHRASYQPFYHHQNKSMSGMDLLKQLEQEKADSKRGKPKIDTSNVKIEGLLGKLPEPGSHNISFQQLEQQQRKKPSHQSRPLSAHAMYYDPYQQQQQQQQQQFFYNQQQLQIPQQQYYPPRSPSPSHIRPNHSSGNKRHK
ncbi:hypothetical protein BD560DRAFT_425721 [Blakeslea trispora]|nr:hypothetical protein BD560DRAFT_425721 [Blakeslea trispora]